MSDNSKKKAISLAIIGLLIIAIILMIVTFNKKTPVAKVSVDNLVKDSLIPVKVDGKYGYIDTNGKMVIEAKYDDANYFNGNNALVIKDDKYIFIDREGKTKLEFDYASYEYNKDTGVWLINDALYNDKLEKISKENIEVTSISEVSNYFKYINKFDKIGGIIDYTGKILWEKEIKDDSTFSISMSNVKYKELTPYCGILNGNEGLFVNCLTGKEVVIFEGNRAESVLCDTNNICRIKYNNNDKEYPSYYEYYYFQDDKEILHTKPSKAVYSIKDSIEKNGFVLTSDNKKYDVCKKVFADTLNTDCKLTSIDDTFSDYSEYTIDQGEVKKDNQVIIKKGNYSDYKVLGKELYLYTISKGKKYIVGSSNTSDDLINLEDGKVVYNLPANINDYFDYTFIYLGKNGDNTAWYYNVVSNKEYIFNTDKTNIEVYMDYIIVNNGDTIDLYNIDFNKFYSMNKEDYKNN